MEHDEHLISIFDDKGNKLYTKSRKDIDKEKDIFRVVLIFAQNRNREIWVAKIPETSKLWGGKFGASAATIVREKENPATAAARALREELGVAGKQTILGFTERLYSIGNIKRFMSYYIYNNAENIQPDIARTGEGQWMPLKKVEEMLQKEQEKFSPLFILAWKGVRAHI